MKLALECPSNLLKDVQPLADFDFILAHLVLTDHTYSNWYKKSKRFKILDNSCNEMLKPCTLTELRDAANKVEPNLVVAPDYLGDCKKTLFYLKGAIKKFGLEKIMPVVQGSDLVEVEECTRGIKDWGLTTLAVPYDILSSRADSLEVMAENRLRVVNVIINRAPIGFTIHLLGMTTLEELTYHNRGWVTSVDTGSPVMHGMRKIVFGKDALLPKREPTMDMMPVDGHASLKSIYYNVAYLRKVLNGY